MSLESLQPCICFQEIALESGEWKVVGGTVNQSLPAMSGKNPRDPMLTDLFPAGTSGEVIDIHKTGMQVSGECKAFVEDQGYAVIAVTGCVEDLSVQADAGKKCPAGLHFQNEIIFLCNRSIGKVLAFEEFGKGTDEFGLAIRNDQLYALVL